MPTVIDSLVVTLGLDPKGFEQGQRQAVESIKKTETQITRSATEIERKGSGAAEFFTGMKTAALGLAAVLAALKIEQFAAGMAKVGSDLRNVSYALGMSAKDLAAWQGAVEHIAGGTAAGVTSSVQAMTTQLQQLKLTGQSSLVPLFQFLGISPMGEDGREKSVTDLFGEMSTKLQGKDPRTATYLMQQAGLDQGLINFLLKPRAVQEAELKHQREQTAMTDANVKAMDELSKAAIGLEQHFEAFGMLIVAEVSPALTRFVGILDDLMNVVEGKMSISAFAEKHLAQGPAALRTPEENDRAARAADAAAHVWESIAPEWMGGDPDQTRLDKANAIRTQLRGYGWSDTQIAGIIANLDRENRGMPLQGDGRADSYGIANWDANRQADFAAWAGHDIRQSTYAEQVAFLNYELTQGKEKSAGDALRGIQNDAGRSGEFTSRLYERPKDVDGEAVARSREAERWRDLLAAPRNGGPIGTDPTGAYLERLRTLIQPIPTAANQAALTTMGATGTGGVTNNVQIASITVQTRATDARGIAAGIGNAVRNTLAAQANSGLA